MYIDNIILYLWHMLENSRTLFHDTMTEEEKDHYKCVHWQV